MKEGLLRNCSVLTLTLTVTTRIKGGVPINGLTPGFASPQVIGHSSIYRHSSSSPFFLFQHPVTLGPSLEPPPSPATPPSPSLRSISNRTVHLTSSTTPELPTAAAVKLRRPPATPAAAPQEEASASSAVADSSGTSHVHAGIQIM
nr:unnamed protein product [Callosobruchus analis]